MLQKMPHIIYSCYVNRSREGENFVPEHILAYQISGTLTIDDGHQARTFHPGELRFIKRNKLAKFVKTPPEGGEFRSVSVFLDQETLRRFSMESGIAAGPDKARDERSVVCLEPHQLYKSYFDSLLPYSELDPDENKDLFELKLREAISLLLKINPGLRDVLFDFNEPGKIDLETFMNKNFYFNVQLQRFAYLTGRSLATFKRDFEKIFHVSPSRWLTQRRLHEAHQQLRQGKSASDVYLEVGFEDLSHFSYAFKKQYGMAPSRI